MCSRCFWSASDSSSSICSAWSSCTDTGCSKITNLISSWTIGSGVTGSGVTGSGVTGSGVTTPTLMFSCKIGSMETDSAPVTVWDATGSGATGSDSIGGSGSAIVCFSVVLVCCFKRAFSCSRAWYSGKHFMIFNSVWYCLSWTYNFVMMGWTNSLTSWQNLDDSVPIACSNS